MFKPCDECQDREACELRQRCPDAPRTFAAELPNVRPASAVRYLKTKRFWITGVIGDNLLRDARGILLSAIETGEPASDTMRKLKASFEPYVGGEDGVEVDGEVVGPARLETIIRTNATDAYNRGRLVEFRENADVVPFVEYSAILDDRTTQVCRELDGKVFRNDDPELDRFKPPLHFNCRSVLVPITSSEPVDDADLATEGDLGQARDLMDAEFGGEK
jgi:SPP1 gp7 family putative phage head morphogenesis protein